MLCACVAATAARAGEDPCPGDVIGSGTVKAVLDGTSFVLDDGREVRLAGIEAPLPPPSASSDADTAAAAQAARSALEDLIANAPVVLHKLGDSPDRYGRTVAQVFVSRAAGLVSVQRAMLEEGEAEVSARLDGRACAADFLARERKARATKLGLWAHSYYEVHRADAASELLNRRGQFVLVEGKVISVRESGGTIYLNFGRRWSEDFTVTILKRNERTFTDGGIEPKTLQGRQVRVRGFVEQRGDEQRGSPWIEATRPEQIEIADQH